jgi:PAS domain S-box-containing protein
MNDRMKDREAGSASAPGDHLGRRAAGPAELDRHHGPLSTGVTARGMVDQTADDLTGRPAVTHWVESRITEPGLAARGNVFFAAVAMTRMPMIVADPNLDDNPIVFANGAFLDLTGYSEDELIGRNCRFLQGARTNPETVNDIRQALAERKPYAGEILNYRRDGTAFWNALFIGPIYDNDGKLLYYFASQLDITRRRASEDAFRQSQKMEAIGQLTAGLAHDFNNMLQVVMGNLEIARMRIDQAPAAAAAAIDRADRGARQAAKVTGQLLAFARKTRLEPRPTNLNTLITEFGEMVARTLGEGVTIDLRLDLALPPCTVDPGQVEMALLNVLVNARDAMPEGGVVTIGTQSVTIDEASASLYGHQVPPGRYVVLSVSDRGEGMEPDVLRRATEPFFTTKGPGRGTGLGLAMVHGFARQSGGRLEIDSELGFGTTLRLLFPESRTAARVQNAPAVGSPIGGSETILLVDDSADVRDIAEHQLAALGYTVLTADSGPAGLSRLEQALADNVRVDLLFTDIVMPGGMNGLALAERALQRCPGLKVLLATGYIEDLVAQGPMAHGMDVLGKPYRQSELAARVREALDRPGRTIDPNAQQPRPHKQG